MLPRVLIEALDVRDAGFRVGDQAVGDLGDAALAFLRGGQDGVAGGEGGEEVGAVEGLLFEGVGVGGGFVACVGIIGGWGRFGEDEVLEG